MKVLSKWCVSANRRSIMMTISLIGYLNYGYTAVITCLKLSKWFNFICNFSKKFKESPWNLEALFRHFSIQPSQLILTISACQLYRGFPADFSAFSGLDFQLNLSKFSAFSVFFLLPVLRWRGFSCHREAAVLLLYTEREATWQESKLWHRKCGIQ